MASDKQLHDLLANMADAEASDLHFVSGYQPMYRIHGELSVAADNLLGEDETRGGIKGIAPPEVQEKLDEATDCDFAIQLVTENGLKRFRANVFSARGKSGACFRSIPDIIPTLPELGFPSDLGVRVISQKNGLILVTGITGSGKTTSLAALIQMLNSAGGRRIITIEEPIEYIYPAVGNSIVTQREVGVDVSSFYEGLRYGLRQDPDVLLVGEIRDRETAQLALSAAETGHLIFATMHTSDAKGAITRLIDLFPSDRHDDIRTQLSLSTRFVLTQHLLASTHGGRRTLALESMYTNYAVRHAIRTGKIESLDSAIQSGRQDGMFSLDIDLRRLFNEGRITLETARAHAKDPSEFGHGG
ncbi:MAG: PilT/PilU family type 4a pilus ATPase [Phycisphaerales bacterium]|nr:PilT/PilU family type 4a pilus ATPase [Phycisphaerales bacterium]